MSRKRLSAGIPPANPNAIEGTSAVVAQRRLVSVPAVWHGYLGNVHGERPRIGATYYTRKPFPTSQYNQFFRIDREGSPALILRKSNYKNWAEWRPFDFIVSDLHIDACTELLGEVEVQAVSPEETNQSAILVDTLP